MSQKVSNVLKNVLNEIKLSNIENKRVEEISKNFMNNLSKSIGESKGIEVFLGGSVAKGTLVKRDVYDIDIFLRFVNENNFGDISNYTEKLIRKFIQSPMIKRVKGSRDYFSIREDDNIIVEVIPVVKVKNPDDSNNVTDLSYFHVNYVKKKLKDKKLQDEIRLLKTFCFAQKCYGAESYIKGFSGYSLELIILHYKSFLNFIKEISKSNPREKLVIDSEKKFRKKRDIFMNINSSKLQSPIILIDPTYKYRNALAALSDETYIKFKKACNSFLRNPSEKYFQEVKKDINKVKESALKKGYEFILLEAHTKKQEGDIAGTKLLKFYNFFTKEISKYFRVKDKGFNYNNMQAARYYFIVENKKQIEYKGPKGEDKKNGKHFKKAHKKVVERGGRLYATEKINFDFYEYIRKWKKEKGNQLKEMSIVSLDVLEDIKD